MFLKVSAHENRTPRQVGFARQTIRLTGLGYESFDKAIRVIYALEQLMTRSLPPNSCHSWAPSLFENFPTIDIGNRYFTQRSEVLVDDIASFSSAIDPHGILAHSGGDKYVHTMDNLVQYYERIKDNEDIG